MNRAHIAYIRRLAAEMRRCRAEAEKYDRLWNELNDAFNAKYELEDHARSRAGRPKHSPLEKQNAKKAMIALSDAYDAGKWNQDRATHCATLLLAEEALIRMLHPKETK